MLVLTRSSGESIMIGDKIEVIFLGVKGTEMKIGIRAPRNIPVHRLEVFNRIKAEKALGSSSDEPFTKG